MGENFHSIGKRIGTSSNAIGRGAFSWKSYWAALISATVEAVAPTNVVLAFSSAKTSLGASDFTIAGFTVNSASWSGSVLTLVLAETVVAGDILVLTFQKTGQTATVTNNVLLINTYTDPLAAYSLRRINGSYTGDSVLVRRDNDDAELAIGFTNNELDTASLLSFVGVNNGYVKSIYDQSGNGKHITIDTARQPMIVDSGVLVVTDTNKPAFETDGVDDAFSATIAGLVDAPALSFFFAYSSALAAAADSLTIHLWNVLNSDGTNQGLSRVCTTALLSGEYMAFDVRSAVFPYYRRIGSSTYRLAANTVNVESNFILPAGVSMYKNGTQVSLDLTADCNVTDDFTPANRNVPDQIDFSSLRVAGVYDYFTSLKYSEIILYGTDKTSDRVAIETNIEGFFLT